MEEVSGLPYVEAEERCSGEKLSNDLEMLLGKPLCVCDDRTSSLCGQARGPGELKRPLNG